MLRAKPDLPVVERLQFRESGTNGLGWNGVVKAGMNHMFGNKSQELDSSLWS